MIEGLYPEGPDLALANASSERPLPPNRFSLRFLFVFLYLWALLLFPICNTSSPSFLWNSRLDFISAIIGQAIWCLDNFWANSETILKVSNWPIKLIKKLHNIPNWKLFVKFSLYEYQAIRGWEKSTKPVPDDFCSIIKWSFIPK